ncbi:polymorphic toxin-type HINT domain-containing protein [Leptospira jelokensis]|uniref:polymorphic toxin-type HINT domain-containing protein n=1 Tax=Leptospira jelokensis TaxID=2484931 RepID=UPI00109167F2|nr:polymorphic toxin-type HINT domain-containing protein [Leptospira jelokensis]TGM06668.1 hypothetical protein EHQ79_01565 [Leptospira jelokensis]
MLISAKNIEEIQVGDTVLSKSDETGEVSYRKVVNTFVRQTDAIYTVSFADGTVLETTWNHPFRVKKHGQTSEKFTIENTEWIQAKDLVSEDVALGVDGRELVVDDVTIDERAETVYNIEVEEYHTYFVGEVGVWVHNECNLVSTVPTKNCGPEMCGSHYIKAKTEYLSASVETTFGGGAALELGFYNEIQDHGGVYQVERGFFMSLSPTVGFNFTAGVNAYKVDETKSAHIGGETPHRTYVLTTGPLGFNVVQNVNPYSKKSVVGTGLAGGFPPIKGVNLGLPFGFSYSVNKQAAMEKGGPTWSPIGPEPVKIQSFWTDDAKRKK